jgi:hypothetical protein
LKKNYLTKVILVVGVLKDKASWFYHFFVNNEPLGAKGPPLVGEELRKEVGKVGS